MAQETSMFTASDGRRYWVTLDPDNEHIAANVKPIDPRPEPVETTNE